MTVTLTSEQEEFVKELVRSGRYQSANELIAESLGMLRTQEEFIHANENVLREQIAVGVEEIRRGEIIDASEAIQKTREKLRARKPAKK